MEIEIDLVTSVPALRHLRRELIAKDPSVRQSLKEFREFLLADEDEIRTEAVALFQQDTPFDVRLLVLADLARAARNVNRVTKRRARRALCEIEAATVTPA